MIPLRDQLPADAAEWNHVQIDLPSLAPDAPPCPFSEEEVMEYVRKESADLDQATPDRLQPLRTARVADTLFWLWRFVESDGTACYVTASLTPDVPGVLQIAEENGLSVEQFILACFYGEVYWS